MSEQAIRVGQVWRRKKDRRQIRVVRQRHFMAHIWSTGDTERQAIDDWEWEGHDYQGKGACYGYYIRTNYELVSQ